LCIYVRGAVVATVVKAVLAARSTMEVNDHLEAVVACPSDGLAEVGELALDVRFA
jgi:hypothetical protein